MSDTNNTWPLRSQGMRSSFAFLRGQGNRPQKNALAINKIETIAGIVHLQKMNLNSFPFKPKSVKLGAPRTELTEALLFQCF